MNKYFTVTTFLLLAAAMEVKAEDATAVTCNMQAAGSTVIWKNELDSKAKITVDSKGNVTGSYKNGTSEGGEGPLVGYCNQSAVAFTVGWTGSSSVTAWSGVYDSSTQKITTLWYLVNGANSSWNAVNAGTDTFKQTK
ncbi:MAG: avidin/streptavidin family protein [Methylococcaceae bacterium]